MAQLRYNKLHNNYRKIEATIRKDFMGLPDNHGVGRNGEMGDMAGERHIFDTFESYQYHCIDGGGWYWDIAWLEDIVVLEESSNNEEEDEE